jgi:hypothetical protein
MVKVSIEEGKLIPDLYPGKAPGLGLMLFTFRVFRK